MTVRINRYIAECGIASRRKAEEYIRLGKISINGLIVTDLSTKVDTEKDQVQLDGQPIFLKEKNVYYMFNKPLHVLTTLSDPEGRPTLKDYIQKIPFRLFPVGRLDWDSSGLLLLTNDGDFSQKIIHPKYKTTKTYLVKVKGNPPENKIQTLTKGLMIDSELMTALSIKKISHKPGHFSWYRLILGEGKNRQIRRMFDHIGFDVLKLERIAIGQLQLGSLKRGKIRPLLTEEVNSIFTPDKN